MLVEKVSRRVIRAQPVAVQQQLMNFVGINYLFELDVLRAQPAYEINCLRKTRRCDRRRRESTERAIATCRRKKSAMTRARLAFVQQYQSALAGRRHSHSNHARRESRLRPQRCPNCAPGPAPSDIRRKILP